MNLYPMGHTIFCRWCSKELLRGVSYEEAMEAHEGHKCPSRPPGAMRHYSVTCATGGEYEKHLRATMSPREEVTEECGG